MTVNIKQPTTNIVYTLCLPEPLQFERHGFLLELLEELRRQAGAHVLTLEEPARVASFTLEVGSVPGASDVARVDVGAEWPRVVASDVPQGTYFIRVRAVSDTGAGPASEELVISVP